MGRQEGPSLSRRQLIAATTGGALLGSAWGLAFRDAASHDESPAVTLAWNSDGAAALFEYRRRRALLLDCPDAATQAHLTELVTGFMRQRIDLLLAPDSTLQTLPTDTRNRWKFAKTLAIDPDTAYPQIGVTDTAINIDGLMITGRRVDTGYVPGMETTSTAWYLEATYGQARIVIVPSGKTTSLVPSSPDHASLFIVPDEDAVETPALHGGSTLAAPTGSHMLDEWADTYRERVVRLHRDTPVTFGLDLDGVSLPAS